jgi:outer membrane usher protein
MKPSPRQQSHVRASASSGPFGLSPVTAVVLSIFSVLGGVQSASVNASENGSGGEAVQFDSTFLRTDPAQTVDVARFARGNMVSPGVYPVEVWLNDILVARQDVRFVASHEGESAHACFSYKTL